MTDIAHETQPKTNPNDRITCNTSKLPKTRSKSESEIVALHLYKNGMISLGKTGEIMQLSKQEMLYRVSIVGTPINYTTDDLQSDLETLDQLLD